MASSARAAPALLASSFSDNVLPAILMGLVGLGVTAGAIAGMVALGRRYSSSNTNTRIALVVAIICLVPFALLGLGATGCSVILANFHL